MSQTWNVATVIIFGHERHVTRLIEVNLKRQNYEVWTAESLSEDDVARHLSPQILILGNSEPGVEALEEYASTKEGLRILRTADMLKPKAR